VQDPRRTSVLRQSKKTRIHSASDYRAVGADKPLDFIVLFESFRVFATQANKSREQRRINFHGCTAGTEEIG
jgi:hypothetical protein